MAKSTWKCHQCSAPVRCDGRNRTTADRIAQWHEDQSHICTDCDKQNRIKSADSLIRQASEEGFPALEGSESQITWAAQLRADKLVSLDEIEKTAESREDYGEILQAIGDIYQKSPAHYWVDNRDLSAEQMIRRTIATYTTNYSPEAAATIESTVYPASSRYNQPAEINQQPDVITVTFPVKDDQAREALRSLNFYWNEDHWCQDQSEITENTLDRVAEAGNHLLNIGIPITIWRKSSLAAAVSGEYHPLKTRWVVSISEKLIGITWNRERDPDYYREAKSIPTSRWKKPKYVTVSTAEYEEILGFAEINDFNITASAQAQLKRAEGNKLAALIAEVSPVKTTKRKVVEKTDMQELPVLGIAEELLDD